MSFELKPIVDTDAGMITERADNINYTEISDIDEKATEHVDSLQKNNILTLKNIVIEARSEDNFINATQLCKAGGKKFGHWYELDSTKELINELKSDVQLEGNLVEKTNIGIPILELVDIKRGGNHSGSWIHPDLAIQLAQWISPSFAIQVSRWIRELMIQGSVSVDSRKTDKELIELQKQLEEKNKLLENKNKLLEESKRELDRLNENSRWLEIKSKNNVSFKLYNEQEGVIYFGSSLYDALNHLYKVGKSILTRVQNRRGQLSTGNSPFQNFKILEKIKSYANVSNNFESYLHDLLSPLRVQVDNKSSQEFFMTSPEWMIRFLKRRELEQYNAAQEINEYLNIIIKNKYDMERSRTEVCKLYNLEKIDLELLKNMAGLTTIANDAEQKCDEPEQMPEVPEQMSDEPEQMTEVLEQKCDEPEQMTEVLEQKCDEPEQMSEQKCDEPEQKCDQAPKDVEYYCVRDPLPGVLDLKSMVQRHQEILKDATAFCVEVPELKTDLAAEVPEQKTDLAAEVPEQKTDLAAEVLELKTDLAAEVPEQKTDLDEHVEVIKKLCNKCQILKAVSDFPADRDMCKVCRNKQSAVKSLENISKYTCPTCTHSFTRKVNYDAHISAAKCISPDEQKRLSDLNKTCPSCKKVYSSRDAVSKHQKSGSCKGPAKPIDNEPKKMCTLCQQELPESSFDFHNKATGKLKERCKPCLSKLNDQRQELKQGDLLYNRKICSVCKEGKYHYEFFKKVEDTNMLWDVCKPCHNINKQVPEKQCSKCLAVKQIVSFSSDTSKSDGHHTICLTCMAANAAELRKTKLINVCDNCNKNFTTPYGLAGHKTRGCLTAIQKEQQKICECGKRFANRKSVLNHKRYGYCALTKGPSAGATRIDE